ncbi:MAG: DUF4435 domain-containing protein [Cyanobacteriota bacterium]|nr:DUF4435 domain-containing protein [Cyanobacteriota bacterium]
MSVETLRASRDKAVVIFTEVSRLYKKDKSALYCFFEGEDGQYYGVRIDTIARPKKPFTFSCRGKEGVLGIYKMLSRRKHYANLKAAYFIDRDFDVSIGKSGVSGIYETPGYSIENFYTSVECFSRILINEFKLRELDEDFDKCIALYQNRQKEFHDAVELLNAWLACQRDKASRLTISNLSVSDFVYINLDKIDINYTVTDLHSKFPRAANISQKELENKRDELNTRTRQRSFRGKFEIEFLLKFLQKLVQEANQGNYPYFTQKLKVKLNISKKTVISDLSQYADTPDCLCDYLESLRSAASN